MWTCNSKLSTAVYTMGVRIILISCMLGLTACSSNPTSSTVSAEHNELYEGQPILAYIAERQSKTPEEAMQRALKAKTEQDFDRALYEYIRAYELDNQHTDALVQIANIHYARKNYRIAYLAYQKALFIEPNLIAAHQGSGLILLRKKQHDLALESFSKAVALDKAQRAEQTEMKTDQATKAAHSTLAIESYNGLGIIYDMKGKFDEARLNYQAALELNANDKIILNNLGYSYYLQSNWSQAERYFTRALQVDSAYQPGWKNLGLVYARQEKYMQALEALEQAMDTPQAYNDIGYVCLLSKRYERAADFFQKAISANPQYYEIAYQNLLRVKRLLDSQRADEKQLTKN